MLRTCLPRERGKGGHEASKHPGRACRNRCGSRPYARGRCAAEGGAGDRHPRPGSPDNVGCISVSAPLSARDWTKPAIVEGQNVAIEYRWAEAHYDRLPALAAELVARKVDVIVTEGGDPSAVAAKKATSTIPVVFHTSHRDPVGSGLVRSLARPGGNLTGFSLHDLAAKRIELVSELLPRAKSVAVLVNPNNPTTDDEIREIARSGSRRGRADRRRKGEQ